MAYLMLYGVGGWSQRWEIVADEEDKVRSEISRVGNQGTGHLSVVDPGTGEPTTLVVAWTAIAAAVVLGSGSEPHPEGSGGRYA